MEGDFRALPRGFRVGNEAFVAHFERTLSALRKAARMTGFQVLALPSVSFASTFDRVPGMVGDKTFRFEDRKGRRLMLSPDCSAGILRWHLSQESPLEPSRVAFLAPVFRYRNQTNRAFHQFGFASINDERVPPGLPDYQLAEVLNVFLRLLRGEFGIGPVVRVSNVGAIRRLLSYAVRDAEVVENLLRELQFRDSDTSVSKLIAKFSHESAQISVLEALLSGESYVRGLTAKEREAYQTVLDEMRAFANLILPGIEVELATADMHASQLLSGIGVQVYSSDGCRLGDGGRYDRFAQAFHPNLHSYVSVCSGVEATSRVIPEPASAQRRDVTLIAFSECAGNALPMVEDLRSRGVAVAFRIVSGRLGQALRAAKNESMYVAVVGRREIADGLIDVIDVVTSRNERVALSTLPVHLCARIKDSREAQFRA